MSSLLLLSLAVWNEKLKFLYSKSNGSTWIKKCKHKRNTEIQLQRVVSKFPYLQNSSVKISKNEIYIYIGFIGRRPTSIKHQGLTLREEFNPYLIWRHGF